MGFTEEELSSMAGYHYLHYEDVIYCSDMHSACKLLNFIQLWEWT